MRDNTLDVDILIPDWGPQFQEDEFAGTECGCQHHQCLI